MTTQNCAECGTRAEPGQSFCDACGAVLSWDQTARNAQPAAVAKSEQSPGFDAFGGAGVPPARAGGPAQAPTAGDTDAPAGALGDNPTLPQPRRPADGTSDADRTDGAAAPAAAAGGAGSAGAAGNAHPAASSGTPGAAGAGAAGAAAAARTPDTDETAPTTPLASAPAPAPAPAALSDTMSDRARSLLVPVADPEAATPAPPPAVPPVLPGRPDADRPQVRAPGHQPDIANGPPCPWCSTPNRPDRHYCARCAMPLVASGDQAAVPAPWWRRLFGGRRQETPWAGDRPRLRRVFDRIGTWITVLVVVTLAVLGFVYIPDGVQNTRDHFAKRAPVSPDGMKASHSYTGHKPELVIDKLSNTWWGPGISQSGQGEWIEATFTEPTRLLDVIITPGVSSRANKLRESALPHRIKATITTKDGKTKTRDLTLDQGAGGQRRPFRVGEVTKVRFTIESAHAASADKQVAIAEIEFFGPSSANRS
ncbi:zinc ribbon domain-containing protein [Streptomyces sp. AC512_CC834]|uniref:NADase-type glycan-binding domain-containing protein n=1 Tax=Streptomyces sp. AC512_CC834 TaxID=2823691 RepID=UPI001C2618D5|nr:zinc ribbon domain-containing protein [Streptomyces sp. AC512_CC834]